jgi:nucleoside diphosphate kinase
MYKDSSQKGHFNDLVNLMTSEETELLVLSREDAINGWREVIGPVDPSKAKQENPNSYELKTDFSYNLTEIFTKKKKKTHFQG